MPLIIWFSALNQSWLLMGSRKTTRHNPRAIHKNFGKHVLSITIILSVKKKNKCLQVLEDINWNYNQKVGISFCCGIRNSECYSQTYHLPDSLHTDVFLQNLVVKDCPNLRSLPCVLSIIRCGIEEPPNGLQCYTYLLQYMENGNCVGSTSIQHSHPSLQKLKLCGSSIQATVHSLLVLDQIRYFIALKILWMEKFHEIVALPGWLGNLSFLQKLYVLDCEKLMYLPTEQAMQHLTKLEKLMIYDFPKLNNE